MDADLFGLEQAPPRNLDRKEAAALVEVLKALRTHPAVAWCERMNSGVARIGGRFVRFGWPGCPDVLGQLKDGRVLGCEVKGLAGKLRPEQAVFLDRIRAAGGVAFVACDCLDVLRELDRRRARVGVPRRRAALDRAASPARIAEGRQRGASCDGEAS